MSEQLLQGLMQLFAIIAKLDGSNAAERNVVSLFLSNQLNVEDTEKYLKFFDGYVEEHSKVRKPSKSSGPSPRLTVRDSSKMLLICTAINEELTQQQKVVVLFTLFSLIRADDLISPIEYEFLTTVADIFNISIKEFKLIETFAWSKQLHDADMEDLLFVSSSPLRKYKISRHIYDEHINGELTVMRVAAIGMYMIRFDGEGTYYLNGLQMLSGEIYSLDTGSVIKGEKSNTLYYSDIVSKFMDSDNHERISFEAKNITYKFANGRIGLHKLNVAEESGKLIGLMGPSGAGKSTLLEILNGNLTPSQGQVLLNGIDIHKNPEVIKGVIGYVPQDDLLIEELTVYQNLFYAAQLCFGEYNKAQIHKLVRLTLISLGLSEITHLKVGNPLEKTISGGERKRVNIALELLRAPSVLFVDEPTSGLSSRDSLNIMDLLKELTLSGKLVFVVIHQPSSDIFKMFDKLLIMDTGGYPIYYGNPVEAIIYFKSRINQINREQAVCSECGNVNPEQIFDIVETKTVNQYGRFTNKRKVSPEIWNEYFHLHQTPPKIKTLSEPVTSNLRIANKLKQWRLFLKRDFLAKINNAQYLTINFLQAPLLAFVLSFVNRYYKTGEGYTQEYSFGENDNIPVYFFIAIIVALFMGLIVSAEEIFHDRRILKRESFLSLSRSSYLLSKVVLLFSMSAIQTLSFVLVGDLVLDITNFTFIQWAILFSVSCFANLLGINISSAFSSAVTIYIMIPILLIPQLILGGIVVKFDHINPSMTKGDKVPFLGDIMASRWAFEGIMVSNFRYNPYMEPLFEHERVLSQAEFKKVYLFPTLSAKASFCKNNAQASNDSLMRILTNNLQILKHHLSYEAYETFGKKPLFLEQLKPQTFVPSLSDSCLTLLDELNEYQSFMFQQSFQEKRMLIAEQTKTPADARQYSENRRKNYNIAVADMVKNTNQAERIGESEGQLYQKLYPIYREPTPDTPKWSLRTHFYSSEKQFLGFKFGTLWFNICVIWFMSFIAYIFLYFSVLNKIISSFEYLLRYRVKQAKKNY